MRQAPLSFRSAVGGWITDPACPSVVLSSGEERGHFGEDLIQHGGRDPFHLAGVASSEIQGAGLVAPHDAGGLDAGALEGHFEACVPRESPAAGDGQHHGGFRQGVEGGGRDDEDGA